ncbi:Putative competence-damage inducible protein [Alphaproteobacteria bacterium SO-S41]|nr:Putative competence-damage inducible protein [Alphaproteobacteria bacterium SO-S41]
MTTREPHTAAILLIGDELLSGRTQDLNLAYISKKLNEVGVQVREARMVPDVEAEIVAAVNALRARYAYVFTTGGIGPTHDDITADSISAAFGVPCYYHPDAYALLEANYPPGEFTEARKRMARTPVGASLIPNPVSRAPGFRVENVFVMAGIPRVMHVMLEGALPVLEGGRPVVSRSIGVYLPEGRFGTGLGALQTRFPDVSIGSYPFLRDGRYGASIVVRGQDPARVAEAAEDVRVMLSGIGGAPFDEETA